MNDGQVIYNIKFGDGFNNDIVNLSIMMLIFLMMFI